MKKRIAMLGLAMVLLLGSFAGFGRRVSAEETNKEMYVAVRNINLHEDDSNDSRAVLIPYRTKVTYLGRTGYTGNWVHVLYNGKEYYYYETAGREMIKEALPEPSFAGKTAYQQNAMDVAKKVYEEWDTAYGHGSSNGKPAADGKYYFDCSGFASYVMDQAMIDFVPTYNISADIETLYKTVSIVNKGLKNEIKAQSICTGTLKESLLKPGDILFFNIKDEGSTTRGYDHCGIYIGNGEMIHSSHTFGGKVRIMPLDDFYKERFVAAKRYLPESVSPANKKHWAAASTTTIYVNKDSDGKVLKRIGLMDELTVLYTDNGNWSYVKLSNGKKGYTLTRNLCSNLSGKGITCSVRNSGLKLYKKASQKAKSITLKAGKKVSLRGKSGKYYKVKYQGSWYYIYAPGKIADKLTTY